MIISKARLAVLGARVRLEAFRRAPARYAQGVVWRIRGLKLRARHRLSELMGNAPHAYPLWIATREAERHAALCRESMNMVPITIVIDARRQMQGVGDTLKAIAVARVFGQDASADDGTRIILLGGNAAAAGSGSMLFVQDVDALKALLQAEDVKGHVLTLQAGDTLAAVALRAYRQAIAADPQAELIYADDDLIDASGRRHTPHFKPQWNAELAHHHDFVTDSCVFACDPALIDRAWPDDVVAVCIRAGQPEVAATAFRAPRHIPMVLHHRRSRPAPKIPAVQRASPALDILPHISIVIPTRDHATLLRTCMAGLAATHYPSFDVTIIDNGSEEPESLAYLEGLADTGVRIVRDPAPFNYAALHNRLVGSLRGPLICFLNNDIEVLQPDWLELMATPALRPGVGAVGARLLYPDGSTQHAGIVTGIGGGAAHAHRFLPPNDLGYFARAHLPQFVSAVTAACLVVEKSKFEAVGGFDAENFAVAFNDVDLCLKLTARGWKSFYEARAVLVHHESKSRGIDHTPTKRLRFAGELAALKRIWNTHQAIDPYHHPELSPFSEHFVVRL